MDAQQIATRLAITQAMADELEDYLTGHGLYWQMIVSTPAGTAQPALTPGALLENLQALHRSEDSLRQEQRAELTAIEAKVGEVRRVYARQWQSMLARELHASIDSWKWYLDDAAEKPAARATYPSEVHLRTRIELLKQALAGDPDTAQQQQRLAELDKRLQGMLQGDAYVGPLGAESAYPRSEWWWLYGRPG